MKYYLYIIFIALSFSNEQFTQKPLDYRAKTIQLNKKYIPSDSDLQQYFDRGIILDKDSTIEITIHTDDEIKARFDKKLLKNLKVIKKNRKDIKYKVRKFRTTIKITAKQQINDLKLSELFDQSIPHLSIRKAIAEGNITIHFNLKDNFKWTIPTSDNTLTLNNRDLLLSKSEDIIITTIKGYQKSNGYLERGDTIKINLDTDQFDIENRKSDKYEISSDDQLIIITVIDKLSIRDLSIDIVGSYIGGVEENYKTKINIVTDDWTSHVSKDNNKIITIGDIDYDVIIPAIIVPGEKKYSMAYISFNSGHNKVLNKHDELRLIINKDNDNDITFNKPDNSQFTHGKINLVNEDIVLTLTKNLKPGKHMEVLSIPFITNINSKNTLGDLTENLSIQLPLQGNPKINIKNGIMKVEPIKVSYQRYEDLTIFLDEKSHVKILTDKFRKDQEIQFASKKDRYRYYNKIIDPYFSIPSKQIDLEIPNYNIGDSFELLTYNKISGNIKNLSLHEIELIDLEIQWDRQNLRVLNTTDGPHEIHFNIQDKYKALSVGDRIIIDIENKNSLEFSDTLNQQIQNKKSLNFSIDKKGQLDGGYFYVSGAINTNGIVDVNFTVKSDNWQKEINKKLRVGHPSVSMDNPQSIIVNRSLNPLPPVKIEKNEFLTDTDLIMVSLYDNNDLPIKIKEGINYNDSHEFYNIITLPFENDSIYYFSAEKIEPGSIENARIEIKLLSEFNRIIFTKDPVLIQTNLNISIQDIVGNNYWIGNDLDKPDAVSISIDAINNKANLFEEEFTLSIEIPQEAGCKWEENIVESDVCMLQNNGRALVCTLDPSRYTSLKKIGKITDLGIFNIISSDISHTKPFSFRYQLTGMDPVKMADQYIFFNPEIKFIKSTKSALREANLREDIYVPLQNTYEINLEELSLIDNGSFPIFERGDIYTIRIDSDGYSWGEMNIIPDGINFLANEQNFQFTISDNYLKRIIFKNLVIKYDGYKKEADSYAQIILEINKEHSGGAKHQIYFQQKIYHTKLTVDLIPNEIVWTRDDHKTPKITIQGAVINPENNIILKIKSDNEEDDKIAWQSYNTIIDNNKADYNISHYEVLDENLIISASSSNLTNDIVVPDWELINLDSPESILTVDISTDGGQNYLDPKLLIKNASLNEAYIKNSRKLLAVSAYQYIGKLIIKGHGEFSSINEGDRLKIIFRSDSNPIKALSDELLQTISTPPEIRNVISEQIDEHRIQYIFTFASPLVTSNIIEIDSLKIMPTIRGENSIITVDYAIRKLGDKRSYSELVVPLKDTIFVHGTELLSQKQKIYNLSKKETHFELPLLSIIDDDNRPLIKSGDKLNITINDPSLQINFAEPSHELYNQQFYIISHSNHQITYEFKRELIKPVEIQLTVFRPANNQPIGLSDIKGEFELISGEKVQFLWKTKIAFSNGVPSFKLSKDKDFLINAGIQSFPDIIFYEDSLLTNLQNNDQLLLILPKNINATWNQSISSIRPTSLLDNNSLSYSDMGDSLWIQINQNSKLNQEFKVSGLALNHIAEPISDGYTNIDIVLINGQHDPSLQLQDSSGKIRTGQITLYLGSNQYITSEEQVINNLVLELEQISKPEEFIDRLILDLYASDDNTLPVGRWKKGIQYLHEWEDHNYEFVDIENAQTRLILKLKKDHNELSELIHLEGLQLQKPPDHKERSFDYGINLVYKTNLDSLISFSRESLIIQYDKELAPSCPTLNSIVLGVDGLGIDDEDIDMDITGIRIGQEEIKNINEILVIEKIGSELFLEQYVDEFEHGVEITINLKIRLKPEFLGKIKPYIKAYCGDPYVKENYTRNEIEIGSEQRVKLVKKERTETASMNFQMFDLKRSKQYKPIIENGYLSYSLFFIPNPPQCEDKRKDYSRARDDLEFALENPSLKESDKGLAYFTEIIENITASSNSCKNPPFNMKSKEILYLLALNHYVNRNESTLNIACNYYDKAILGRENANDYKEFVDCLEPGPEQLANDFINIIESNSSAVEKYYKDDNYEYSSHLISDLEDAQNTLLELESLDGWSRKLKQEKRINGDFHKNYFDFLMLLNDIKELNKKYIKRKNDRIELKGRKTGIPDEIRKGKTGKIWRKPRLKKYNSIVQSYLDTNNVLQMYESTERRPLPKHKNIKIQFVNDILSVPLEIQPSVVNQGDASNLHNKKISNFNEVVEFPKMGIYKVDLDLEKDRKRSQRAAVVSTGLIILILLL